MTSETHILTPSREAGLSQLSAWWCQANANQSPICQQTTGSCRQLTPLGQRDGAVLLEDGAAVEMAVEIKMVEG